MRKDSSKATILVITLGFIVVFLLLKQQWAIYTALAIGIVGTTSKWAAVKIEWLWFKLAHLLSKIIPTLLLAAIFYLFLFPISLISKLFRKDPLLLKNNKGTTFQDVAMIDIKKSMEKTW